MSHPFGDLLTQHLHRKHGLSQAKLAAGILQTPSIISDMSQGKRLHGPPSDPVRDIYILQAIQ
ncbi:MAG TPA: hypothetical protein PKE45_04905 [Caldilineaceae bacterium]|nr:hypothetical protein [Caldilineaceae bacterium]